ncbi:hypothetical protein HN51_045834 [Arachis hypogaea]|uniref:DUF632 domain-containing protein n=1 Tax=Arachis hypogaea TaxID=3818 RepID=A0A444XWY5_ARAHY|nr:nitrate regulatory gene2 protein-like [Arachis hypogaea]RYQ94308.1 hypothetical protein Ahy_B08g089192 [Arachis hypogaea]
MAKGAPKLQQSSQLVSLCKERKEFIKKAKNFRYDFATSFVEYLESLLKIGDALNRYVDQELVICADCSNISLSEINQSEEEEEEEEEKKCLLESTSCKFEYDDGDCCTYDHDFDSYVTSNVSSCSSTHHHDHNHHNSEDHSQRLDFANKIETPKCGNWFNDEPLEQPMCFVYHNDRFMHDGTNASTMFVEDPQKNGTEGNNSTWDFLDPFGMEYDFNAYDQDINESVVREREGIPELEEESEAYEQSSAMSVVFDEKETENEAKIGEDAQSEAEKTTEQCSECPATATPVSISKIDLKEAMLEVNNEFKNLFDSGEEFKSLMEVGKLPYKPKSSKLRAFASCVLRPIFPSVKTSLILSYMLYKPSRAKALSMKNNVHTSFSDLSSTLEELYVWEKKLSGAIMVVEKLRIQYERQYKKLKDLDGRGSEFDKIDDTLSSVKLLNSEIDVAISSIDLISRNIDGLRDNKLLPELKKLIEGLIRLWKIMSDCHHKQFQAISMAKSHVHILDSGGKKKPSSKATLRLERIALNWSMCFSNFINTQKTLVKNLNDWLRKHIIQEEIENSENGVDPIFNLCNDWCHEIHKISETIVSEAISTFASNLHQLYEKQNEEQLLKVKVQHFLRDYKHMLKYYCDKNGIKSKQCSCFYKMKSSEDFMEVPLLRESDEKLAASRVRLVEEKKRHQEAIKHVNDLASSCFQPGLFTIFEALETFCLENLKIYEQLKLRN